MSDIFLEATAAYHREMPPEPIDRDAAIAAQTAMYADEIRSLLMTPVAMLTKREEALRDDTLAHLHGELADKPLAFITYLALADLGSSLLAYQQGKIESAIQYQARKLAVVDVEKSEYETQNN